MESGSFATMCRVCAIVLPMIAVCGYARAQTTTGTATPPVTRASILRELQALKSVGFDINDENYPNSLQQSLRKLEAMEATHQTEAGAAVQGSEKPAMPSVPQ
ncbi:DUF4148 domain-containing protein [Cupriavidus metallidurans]|uniref:DUF4148 domain-containing protein n=1 Tax=Cupriavidus metallidurans TaxID=119219 RepID=UPI001CC95E3A|nr:DUF4148 domain-containing protein [Cupriavidus metallidurans]UBM09176.1 DUF4148 domain-containing protein [Cupriavidus metallidurans]